MEPKNTPSNLPRYIDIGRPSTSVPISTYKDGDRDQNIDTTLSYVREFLSHKYPNVPKIDPRKIGEGHSGTVYAFNIDNKGMGVKIYKNSLGFDYPKLKDSPYYDIPTIEIYKDKTYGLFPYYEDYRGITYMKFPDDCITGDARRWKVVFNIVTALLNIHKTKTYHRDISCDNILVRFTTDEIKFIDMDTSCISKDDCADNVGLRFNQNDEYAVPGYTVSDYVTDTETNSGYIDWYAMGVVIVKIFTNSTNDKMIEKDKYLDIDSLYDNIIDKVYTKCPIHRELFRHFYDLILRVCLDKTIKDKYKAIKANYDEFSKLYHNNLSKEDTLRVGHDGGALNYAGNLNYLKYIITHAFINHNIVTDVITDDISSCDLLLLGTNRLNTQKDSPMIPYISVSIEPFRVVPYNNYVQNKHYPICEINTIKTRTSLHPPWSKEIIEESQNTYKINRPNIQLDEKFINLMDNKIKSFWVPYIVPYYIGSIDLGKEYDNSVRRYTNKGTYDFMYVASNCSNEHRELFFTLLKKFEDKDKFIVSAGKCQKTTEIAELRGGSWNLKLIEFPTSAQDWDELGQIYSRSKFTVVFENSNVDGYITEKIMTAFQSGTIPIYWGPPEIKDVFNPNSFIYINDILERNYRYKKEIEKNIEDAKNRINQSRMQVDMKFSMILKSEVPVIRKKLLLGLSLGYNLRKLTNSLDEMQKLGKNTVLTQDLNLTPIEKALEKNTLNWHVKQLISSNFARDEIATFGGMEKLETYLKTEILCPGKTEIYNCNSKDQTYPGAYKRVEDKHREQLHSVCFELCLLAMDESDNTGWRKYLKEPVFLNDEVPEMFKYRENPQTHEIINLIKTSFAKTKISHTGGGAVKIYRENKNKYLRVRNYK